ncbi:MAG: helix-turn-helix domain-containing protein [Betaproteobacteria bacterium]|nr:helix-turn-helix domain-containing protein [Betaproteobacteria bacterium]MDE2622125.1 helix-turn-helix domain-containing protein [Betaproteobacteria bacterium]
MTDQPANPLQPGAGALLAALRQQRGQGLQEISQRLKFSSKQLAALEAGQYDALPDMTFVRAMVRAYARHLGADVDSIVQALELERPDAVPRLMMTPQLTVHSQGVGFFREERSTSRRWIIAGLLVLAAALAAAWIWHRESVTEAQVSATAPVATNPDGALPLPAEQPKPLPPDP